MKILIIKHGALGDIVLAMPAMAAIRAAHKRAEITLLTTAPYAAFLRPSQWFDDIIIDDRPSFWNIPGILRLRRDLRGYGLVYDLQTSARSSRYFALAGRPPWSGIAKGCSMPDAAPNRARLHTRERLKEQLDAAGIFDLSPPDLTWLTKAKTTRFNLPERFALLVPGAAAHRPEKRWPAENFAELAAQLPMPTVIVGGKGEAGGAIPGLDLMGKTNLLELAAVAAKASLAIGNDTGPMHLAAALGVPSVVLFSGASDPGLTAPRYQDGGWATVVRSPNLRDLPVAQVLAALP
jgi:ADP-heptose:LPS heptosyltransferase